MENRLSYMNQGSSSSYRRPYRRSEEFQEEDIWNVIKEDPKLGFKIDERNVPKSPLSISRRLPSAVRMIPGTSKHQDHDRDVPKLVQHSAPVSIPDWPKIYGESPKDDHDNLHGPDRFDSDYDIDILDDGEESDVDCEEWDGGGNRLHSHEWLAEKFARSQISSSFSVCEGAGRTLKGRDLSRVRNAVLAKTGFI